MSVSDDSYYKSTVEVVLRERADSVGRGHDHYTIKFAKVRSTGRREDVYRTEYRRATREQAYAEADILLRLYKSGGNVAKNARVDRVFIAGGKATRRPNGW